MKNFIKGTICTFALAVVIQACYADFKFVFDNKDKDPKWFALSKSDNDQKWLNFTDSTWGETKFDKKYQIKVDGNGKSKPLNVPSFSGGARLFVFNEEFQGGAAMPWGRPDLSISSVLYDKLEGGGQATGGTFNQTSVDFFAIPLQVQLNKGEKHGFKDTATSAKIIADLKALPAPFTEGSKKVHKSVAGTDKIIDLPRFRSPLKCADGAGSAFATWQDDKIPGFLKTVAEKWSGKTKTYGGTDVSFSNASGNTIQCNGQTITLTGKQAIQNDYSDIPGGLLSSAMLRGILTSDVEDWGNWDGHNQDAAKDMAKYYQKAPYNAYCKVLHEKYLINGMGYTMPYDDYFHCDASLPPPKDGDTITVTALSLGGFKAEAPPAEEVVGNAVPVKNEGNL